MTLTFETLGQAVRRILPMTTSRKLIWLDNEGIDVWKSRYGWYWARVDQLRCEAPVIVGEPVVKGPFDSAAACADHAWARLTGAVPC